MARRGAEQSSAPFLPGFAPQARALSSKIVYEQRSTIAPAQRRRESFNPKTAYSLFARQEFERAKPLLGSLRHRAGAYGRGIVEGSPSFLWSVEALALQELERTKASPPSPARVASLRNLRSALLGLGLQIQLAQGTTEIKLTEKQALSVRPEIERFFHRWIHTDMPSVHDTDPEEAATRDALERKLHTRTEWMEEICIAIETSYPFGDQAETLVRRIEEMYQEARDLIEARIHQSVVHSSHSFPDLLRSAYMKQPPSSVPHTILEAIRQADRLRLIRDRLYYLYLAG